MLPVVCKKLGGGVAKRKSKVNFVIFLMNSDSFSVINHPRPLANTMLLPCFPSSFFLDLDIDVLKRFELL